MKLLALDTATECCSAALWIDGELRSREHFSAREHAERLLPMVDELLAEAGLRLSAMDAVAFGRGPGGFTGVRIATGVAQGLAFGAGLPVVPVSDLTALAAGARRVHGRRRVLPVMDARMAEAYWSAVAFDADGSPSQVLDERVSSPQAVCLPEGLAPPATGAGGGPGRAAAPGEAGWFGAGPGWRAYADALAALAARLTGVDDGLFPHAQDVAALAAVALAAGEAVAPEHAAPVYLRDRVASLPRRQG